MARWKEWQNIEKSCQNVSNAISDCKPLQLVAHALMCLKNCIKLQSFENNCEALLKSN